MYHSRKYFVLSTMKKDDIRKMRKKIIPPPPLMVFSSKLEICQCHGDKSSDNQENDEYYEQNAVNGVNPVTPYTSKYVVKFNVDSTERQKPCHSHLRKGSTIPRQRWYLPRKFCGAARSLKLSFAILPSNPTQY